MINKNICIGTRPYRFLGHCQTMGVRRQLQKCLLYRTLFSTLKHIHYSFYLFCFSFCDPYWRGYRSCIKMLCSHTKILSEITLQSFILGSGSGSGKGSVFIELPDSEYGSGSRCLKLGMFNPILQNCMKKLSQKLPFHIIYMKFFLEKRTLHYSLTYKWSKKSKRI